MFQHLKIYIKKFDIQTRRKKVEGMNYKRLFKRAASIIILFVVNWEDSLRMLFLISSSNILLTEK